MGNPGAYRLLLMIGPGVPIPVPAAIIQALVSVQVTSSTEGASAFQLTFNLSPKSPLHTLFLLAGSSPFPLLRVVIIVIVNGGMPIVLMDGVMTRQQVAGDTAHPTLTITGEDLSKAMDYIELDGIPYPAQPPNVRVMAVLAKYLALGVTPVVIPTVIADVPIPTDQIPRQQGTDLHYVKQLAEESGYEFYVDPGPLPLQSIAYWGPKTTLGIPQPALNVNMGAWTNVESLSFTFDAERATMPIVMIYPKETKVPIPIPIADINPLSPPLGLIPPIPKHFEIDRESARKSPAKALLNAFARAARSVEAVSGDGSLDVLRYGHVLKARSLVGVRGAGTAYDGLYFVSKVTHAIKPGEYKQNFSLVRNGLVSTVPRVPA